MVKAIQGPSTQFFISLSQNGCCLSGIISKIKEIFTKIINALNCCKTKTPASISATPVPVQPVPLQNERRAIPQEINRIPAQNEVRGIPPLRNLVEEFRGASPFHQFELLRGLIGGHPERAAQTLQMVADRGIRISPVAARTVANQQLLQRMHDIDNREQHGQLRHWRWMDLYSEYPDVMELLRIEAQVRDVDPLFAMLYAQPGALRLFAQAQFLENHQQLYARLDAEYPAIGAQRRGEPYPLPARRV